MSLNRREMLRLGAAGAGSVMLSSAARPSTLPSLIFAAPPLPAAPIAPPQAPLGINPQLFAKAKAALDSRPWIRDRNVRNRGLLIAPRDPRFHLVDRPAVGWMPPGRPRRGQIRSSGFVGAFPAISVPIRQARLYDS